MRKTIHRDDAKFRDWEKEFNKVINKLKNEYVNIPDDIYKKV